MGQDYEEAKQKAKLKYCVEMQILDLLLSWGYDLEQVHIGCLVNALHRVLEVKKELIR